MRWPNTGTRTPANWRFKVFRATPTKGNITFHYTATAGTLIQPPYPLPLLNLPACPQTMGTETTTNAWWKDYQDSVWARSEGTAAIRYFYHLQEGWFYPDGNNDGQPDRLPGDCVPWLDRLEGGDKDRPVEVVYDIAWPPQVPELQVGETLLAAKHELPQINGQAAAEVIYDQVRASQPSTAGPGHTKSAVRLFDPLSPLTVTLASLPMDIASENDKGQRVIFGTADGKKQLPYYLRSRLSDDLWAKQLSFKGILDTSGAGEPLLLTNVMSDGERNQLRDLSRDTTYRTAIDNLYHLTRNPRKVDANGDGADPDLLIGYWRPAGRREPRQNTKEVEPQPLRGVPMALTAGAADGTGYVTLAFNNDRSLAPLPVSLQVIKVACGTYQGELKVVESDNVFDEQLTLRHSGDFGGEPDKLTFEWYYQPDQTGAPPAELPDPERNDLKGWIRSRQKMATTTPSAGRAC